MKITLKIPVAEKLIPHDKISAAMQEAADDAADALKVWYGKLPEDYFDSDQPNFPDGTPKHGRARSFMYALTQNWESQEVTSRGFSLAFKGNREGGSPWGLRLQEYGGTITPKNVRALTIPLTAEARGRRAKEFSSNIHELFAIGKSQASGDKLGTLVWRDDSGRLHAAYALRKKSDIKPLHKRRGHHAIPQPDELARLILPVIKENINAALKQ